MLCVIDISTLNKTSPVFGHIYQKVATSYFNQINFIDTIMGYLLHIFSLLDKKKKLQLKILLSYSYLVTLNLIGRLVEVWPVYIV
jgi:hypothetical protein